MVLPPKPIHPLGEENLPTKKALSKAIERRRVKSIDIVYIAVISMSTMDDKFKQ